MARLQWIAGARAMTNLSRFKTLQKNKKFIWAISVFHLIAIAHATYIIRKEHQMTVDGAFVVFYTVTLAMYWKLFARVKRNEYDKKQ